MVDLSVIVMAKNNADTIEGVVRNGLHLGDEVIVVDTGSTDRTRQLAEGAGARLVEFTGEFDYSTPRNLGNDAASGAWVFHLDTDEYVSPHFASRLRALMEGGRFQNFTVPQIRVVDGVRCPPLFLQHRFFRRDRYHFEGLVYESTYPIDTFWYAPVLIDHHKKNGFTRPLNYELGRRELRELNFRLFVSPQTSQDVACLLDRLRHLYVEPGQLQNDSDPYFIFVHELYQRALTTTPAPVDIPLVISAAFAYEAANRYDVMFLALDSIKDRTDLPYEYWRLTASALFGLGMYSEALHTIDEGLARYPDNWDATVGKIRILLRGYPRNEQAIQTTAFRLRELFPEHPGLLAAGSPFAVPSR